MIDSNDIDIWNQLPGDSHTDKLLKETFIDFLCRMQDNKCLVSASRLFKSIPREYFSMPNDPRYNNTIDTHLYAPVYKYHSQNSYDYQDWFLLNDLYQSTINPTERSFIITALAQSRFFWIINFYLQELLVVHTRIRPQDFFDIFTNVGRNPSGRFLVWAFVRERWQEINAR